MPLFKRKDKTTIAELEEYYANQNRNRNSKAWVMALLSLLITLLVLAALFFGGRWLYRTVTGDDNVTVTTQTDNEEIGAVPSFGEIRTDDDANNDSNDTREDENDETNTNEDTVASNGGVVSDEAAVTTRDVAGENTDNNDRNSSEDGSTIVAGTEVPNTGANELIALLPLVAGVAGYTISRKRQLDR